MKRITTVLIFCVIALLALGMVMLYSSSTPQYGTSILLKQLIWFVIGLVACVVAACSDYRKLKQYSPYLLVPAVIGLMLVFVPHIGFYIGGSYRWIGHGSLRLQPSEFAKFALVMFLAYYCEYNQRKMGNFREGILIPVFFIGFILALIFKEPDYGCSILLAATAGCMLVAAGAKLRYGIVPAVCGAVFITYSILHNPVRLKRILAWLHPEENKLGAGHQAYQSMLAFGRGGWIGVGLGNGRQKFNYVPEHHTDFIFPIIGEELGLIATFAVLITFIVLLYCAGSIARRASDTFGILLGAGITFLMGFQVFINIGVVTGILPNKGMPLPFISYGGSNLVMMLLGIGLLLSISRFANEPEKRRKNPFEIRSPELADV